ncbi:MAG: LysM peptidoglycan-binding domain-containing protein [Stagnimonas sp.]|nr:LysM peptidoglycan-binding domain-containing protein [Stagnimonas sp.]
MTQYKAIEALVRVATLSAAAAVLAACATAPTPAQPVYTVTTAPKPPVAEPAEPFPDEGLEPVDNVFMAREAAPELGLREDAPLRYVVKKGDTLWEISNKFLADAWQWPELWYVNGKIANPHLIYPGDVLELAYLKGRPVLTRGGSGLERVSPQVREVSLGSAVPGIPIDAIRNFLRGPRVVDAETLNRAPYILDFADSHVLGAEGIGVFIQKLPADTPTDFAVVRKGDAYKDPVTNELLGYEAIPTGEVELRVPGAPAEGVLTQAFREVLRGDRLLPLEEDNFQANFYPHAPAGPVGGRIISVFEGVSQIAQYQIVTLNRGGLHGIEPGHVLSILQARRSVRDPYTKKMVSLPEQYAGQLMVFKVSPKLCYGLVMSATRPIHLLDKVEKPDPTAGR